MKLRSIILNVLIVVGLATPGCERSSTETQVHLGSDSNLTDIWLPADFRVIRIDVEPFAMIARDRTQRYVTLTEIRPHSLIWQGLRDGTLPLQPSEDVRTSGTVFRLHMVASGEEGFSAFNQGDSFLLVGEGPWSRDEAVRMLECLRWRSGNESESQVADDETDAPSSLKDK